MSVIFVLSVLAQEEIPLEEAFAKIEERPAPLETVTADVDIRGGDLEAGDRVVGRIECARGVSSRRWFGILSSSGAGFLQEDFAGPETFVFQTTHASSEDAFHIAARMAPSSILPMDRGPMGSKLARYGIECSLLDVALHPRRLRFLGGEVRAAKRKDGNCEFTALSVRWRDLDYTMTWLFDANTGRLEKEETRSRGRTVVAECLTFAKVGGVELPERVRIKRSRSDREDIEIAWTNFQTTEKRLPAPAWVSDSPHPPP